MTTMLLRACFPGAQGPFDQKFGLPVGSQIESLGAPVAAAAALAPLSAVLAALVALASVATALPE